MQPRDYESKNDKFQNRIQSGVRFVAKKPLIASAASAVATAGLMQLGSGSMTVEVTTTVSLLSFAAATYIRSNGLNDVAAVIDKGFFQDLSAALKEYKTTFPDLDGVKIDKATRGDIKAARNEFNDAKKFFGHNLFSAGKKEYTMKARHIFEICAEAVSLRQPAKITDIFGQCSTFDKTLLVAAVKLGQDNSVEARKLRAHESLNEPSIQDVFTHAEDIFPHIKHHLTDCHAFLDALKSSLGDSARSFLITLGASNHPDVFRAAEVEFKKMSGEIMIQSHRRASADLIRIQLHKVSKELSQVFSGPTLDLAKGAHLLREVAAIKKTFNELTELMEKNNSETNRPHDNLIYKDIVQDTNQLLKHYAPGYKSLVSAFGAKDQRAGSVKVNHILLSGPEEMAFKNPPTLHCEKLGSEAGDKEYLLLDIQRNAFMGAVTDSLRERLYNNPVFLRDLFVSGDNRPATVNNVAYQEQRAEQLISNVLNRTYAKMGWVEAVERQNHILKGLEAGAHAQKNIEKPMNPILHQQVPYSEPVISAVRSIKCR